MPVRTGDEPAVRDFGEWTVAGIVKRLDDQKRMIDGVRHELEELKSTGPHNISEEPQLVHLSELTQNIETALTANRQLTNSVIKIRRIVSELSKENERLRREIEGLRADLLQTPTQTLQSQRLSDAYIKILQVVDTGAKSSTEVSRIICRSREHTSRMIRKMVEAGVLRRQCEGDTPRYTPTEAGRKVLRTYGGPSLPDDVVP